MNRNRTSSSKSKPEEVIAYPGKRPVKSSDAAKGGNPNPDDTFTGGGKIKSATRQSEAVLDAQNDEEVSSTDAAPLSNKEGMAKSSQREKPEVSTTTQQPRESRIKPNAEDE